MWRHAVSNTNQDGLPKYTLKNPFHFQQAHGIHTQCSMNTSQITTPRYQADVFFNRHYNKSAFPNEPLNSCICHKTKFPTVFTIKWPRPWNFSNPTTMPLNLMVIYLAVMHVLNENRRTVNYNCISRIYPVFHEYGLRKRPGHIRVSLSDNKLYRDNNLLTLMFNCQLLSTFRELAAYNVTGLYTWEYYSIKL